MSGTSWAWQSFAYVGVIGRGFPAHIAGCPGRCATLAVALWEVFRYVFTAVSGEATMVVDP